MNINIASADLLAALATFLADPTRPDRFDALDDALMTDADSLTLDTAHFLLDLIDASLEYHEIDHPTFAERARDTIRDNSDLTLIR